MISQSAPGAEVLQGECAHFNLVEVSPLNPKAPKADCVDLSFDTSDDSQPSKLKQVSSSTETAKGTESYEKRSRRRSPLYSS